MSDKNLNTSITDNTTPERSSPSIETAPQQVTDASINNIPKVLIGIAGLLLILLLGLIAWFFYRNNPKQQLDSVISSEFQSVKKVATDVNFDEQLGQLFPGFPAVPVYPEAELKGSAKTNTNTEPDQGFHVVWEYHGTAIVPEIMKWYETELPKMGWEYFPPDDPTSITEQVAQISNDTFVGYMAGEVEHGEIEIIIDVRYK